MNVILIFVWIYAAMIAMSFWESYVEGRNSWDKKKLGWKLKIGKYHFSAYHFYLFCVMWPLLLTLPLVIYGWDVRLAGILFSAYFSGMVLQDFMWFVVNPVVKLSEFNSSFASYYPWIRIGRFEIPAGYVLGVILALLSWYFVWM